MEGVRHGDHGARHVIQRQQVGGRQRRRHLLCRCREGEGEVAAGAPLEIERPGIDEVAVGAQLDAGVATVTPQVLDMDGGLPAPGGGGDGQLGDGEVLTADTDALVGDVKRQDQWGAQRLGDAVTEEHQPGGRARAGGRLAEGQRPLQVGVAVARSQLVEGAAEPRAVAGHVGDDPRPRAHCDQGHAVVRTQPIDQRPGARAGLLEAARGDVGGLHRAGDVDDHDGVAGQRARRHGHRPHQRQHQERGGQQLEQEQPRRAQPLPRDPRLAVEHGAAPVEGAGHPDLGAADPEDVQRHDHREREPEECGQRRDQAHRDPHRRHGRSQAPVTAAARPAAAGPAGAGRGACRWSSARSRRPAALPWPAAARCARSGPRGRRRGRARWR